MKPQKNGKTFFTHGWIFYVSLIITASPLWLGAVFAIIALDAKILFFGMLIFPLMLPLPPLCWATRFIYLKNGVIKTKGVFFCIFLPIQHRVSVNLCDVEFIELKFIDGNSRGHSLGSKASNMPCLILIKKDNSIERIILFGYSNKQVSTIKQAILEENNQIIVLKDWITK